MTPGRHDDALAWDGDDDPTLDVGLARDKKAEIADAAPSAPAPTALPDGYTAVGKGSGQVGRVAEDGTITLPGEKAPIGNAALVTIGVLGGVYALYTVGWIIGGLRLQGTAEFLIAVGAFQFGLWLAVAAPVLWFVTTYLLTRGAKTWVRIAWLAAGAALLIPWPFIMTGAIGQ